MNEQRRELLQNTLTKEDRIALGPSIFASLTVPAGGNPKTARFEIISKQPKDIDVARHQGETPDGVSEVTITESNSTKFHDDFRIYMGTQGYRMTPATDKVSPDALFSEEVDIAGKSLRTVISNFQRGLMEVKKITSSAIYHATGPDAPNSSQGNAR